MIVIPREDPVIQKLNSYFLQINKLVEHYQGEVGTGAIYFKSPASEAAIFFDEANLLNSCYCDKKEQLLGQAAFKKIIETSSINNFSVSVFHIIPERLYFWANLSNAEVLYGDLNSEFTDFEGLIKKLGAEKLSGFIDVKLNQDAGGGIIFLFYGQIIGVSSAKGDNLVDYSVEYRDDLISKIQKVGGVFIVKKIQLNITPISAPLATPKIIHEIKPKSKPVVVADRKPETKMADQTPAGPRKNSKRVLEMLEALLSLLERVIQANRKLKVDFETILNKKFVEKADKYDFLDPFFDEFRYANGRIEYAGKASSHDLVEAITECVREIVASLGIINTFRKYFESWKKGFANEIIDFDIEI